MNKILLSSTVAMLLLVGCTEEKKPVAQTTEVAKQTTETVAQTTASVSTTNTATPTKIADVSKPVVENKVEKAPVVEVKKVEEVKKEEIKTVANPEKKEESTQNTQANAVEANNNTAQTEQNVVQEPQGPSGEELFKACASCHGQKAEKEALGKSQVIKGWDKQKIVDAINGYKAGTYGREMKNIMKGQVSNKTDVEIDALATFISNL